MAQFPEKPNLEWLRKQAKRRLRVLRQTGLPAQLAHAQFDLAKDFGFKSWRELKTNVDAITVPGRMIVAAKNGDAPTLSTLLDAHPELIDLRAKPYQTTLLHAGAAHLDVVDLLLKRGSIQTSANAGTTRTRCTGPPPRASSRWSAVSPMREAM